MNRIFLFCATILGLSVSSFAQPIKSKHPLFNTDSTRRSYTMALPAISYSQETGWLFGLVTLSSFYLDKEDPATRNSNIAALASITTKKQSNFAIKPDLWTAGNKYHMAMDFKYKDFPFNFYGTGNKTLAANQDVITQKLIKLNAEVEKKITQGFYLGVNSSFENYRYNDKESGGIYSEDLKIFDKDGGNVLFMGVSQVIDSRNSNNYTTNGTYLKINYSYAPDFWGGSNFSGSNFKVDFRSFKPYNEKALLGINFVYQSIQGSRVPFYLLPQLGNDQVMRGYYTGRYRDQNLIALQAEYKYRFMQRLGLVAFGGIGTVYAYRGLNIDALKPSLGLGGRYFIDTKRGTTLRLDYAVGEKRDGEKRQKGFYLSFGEAF